MSWNKALILLCTCPLSARAVDLPAVEQNLIAERSRCDKVTIVCEATYSEVANGATTNEVKRHSEYTIHGKVFCQVDKITKKGGEKLEVYCRSGDTFVEWSAEPAAGPAGAMVIKNYKAFEAIKQYPWVDPRKFGLVATPVETSGLFNIDSFVGRPERSDVVVSENGDVITAKYKIKDGVVLVESRFSQFNGVLRPLSVELTYYTQDGRISERVTSSYGGANQFGLPSTVEYKRSVDDRLVSQETTTLKVVTLDSQPDPVTHALSHVPPGTIVHDNRGTNQKRLKWSGTALEPTDIIQELRDERASRMAKASGRHRVLLIVGCTGVMLLSAMLIYRWRRRNA
jgi:hypothetical protein